MDEPVREAGRLVEGRLQAVSVRRISAAVGALTCTVGLSGCFMSDPDPFPFGYRMTEGSVEVFVPMCPEDRLESIRAADVSGERVELFSATRPTPSQADKGSFIIHDSRGWAPEGFEERQIFHSSTDLPKLLEVDYGITSGSGAADVADLDKVAAATLEPGQYWTRNGVMTAEQINKQFHCNNPAS
ncbi:hypothetical protein [Kitasatospora sp. NPDC057015]|uniref:hypothetical protein n=1 Tax=Kitasatospora sp. NPDC057015 TaxID=3346001 RepID=UPI00363F32EC